MLYKSNIEKFERFLKNKMPLQKDRNIFNFKDLKSTKIVESPNNEINKTLFSKNIAKNESFGSTKITEGIIFIR